jgi:hypothetical protein
LWGPPPLAHRDANVPQCRVLRSIETPDGGRCVGLFARPDATFGFEVYRRDGEDPRGWYPIGAYATDIFPTEAAALRAALVQVTWLRELIADASKLSKG